MSKYVKTLESWARSAKKVIYHPRARLEGATHRMDL